VKINSSDPFAPPVIDLGYFTNPFDLPALRQGIKNARQLVTAPAWKGYILQPVGDFANATTDDEIDQVLRADTGTFWHIVGTASMTPANAGFGVVNPDLRVKGVTGLRIVDASVIVRLCRCQSPL